MNNARAIIAGVCVVGIAVGVWLYASRQQTHPVLVSHEAGQSSVPAGWREYKNPAYRFTVLHPKDLEVTEYPEGGNAVTITFQNQQAKEGFQLFIVPYEEQQISDERFAQDIPSGIRADTADITIDGVVGAAFYSTDAFLGETREIWFIRNGFLFEVTAAKPLDIWLDGIMQAWKFL